MKIDDIAKMAQVSRSAVSLALNGKPGVSEETREKIIKLAKENGYIGRNPKKFEKKITKSSRVFRFVACTNTGIVSEQYESLSFFMELLNYIDQSISSRGYSLIISSINTDTLEEELQRLEQEQPSAGILLLGTNLKAGQIKAVEKVQPNVVVLDTCIDTLHTNFVLINNTFGAYQAGQHLLELGHKKIGYVESDSRMYNFSSRKDGFLQAIEESGSTIEKEHFFSISPTVVTSQAAFKQKLMGLKNNLPTALFCECDYMAISVIKSLTELGIQVPETVSVIGFDNIFEAQIITPELTTIHVEKQQMAAIAVDKLIKYVEEKDRSKMKVFIDTELVKRRSCTAVQTETVSPSPAIGS